jgi:hypothetical protein
MTDKNDEKTNKDSTKMKKNIPEEINIIWVNIVESNC